MKAEASWSTIMMVVATVSVLAFIIAFISDGIPRILFAVCGMIMLVCVILIHVTRIRYLEIFDRESTVECLKMKRPGIVRDISEEIIPKGKMPKE